MMIRHAVYRVADGAFQYLVDLASGAPSYLPADGMALRVATPDDEALGATMPGYAPLTQPSEADTW